VPASSFLPKSTPFRMTAVVAIVVILILAGAGGYALLHKETPKGHIDQITLAAPATSGSPETTDGVLISHLMMTGTKPGKMDFTVSLTDMKGRPLPINGGYGVQLGAINLNSGDSIDAHDMNATDAATTPTFTAGDPGLGDGWWRVTTIVSRPDGAPVSADFYLMLPDPNLAGFDAPSAPQNDAEAEAALNEALTQMSQWTSVRWWEWLSGGNDSLIMARLAVTTPDANGQPPSFENDMLFAGGFERKDTGAPPPAPQTDHYSAVTIGDQGWSRNADGEVKEMSPIQYLPISRYPETYAGATAIQSGIEDEVDGRLAKIVTFHVPTQPSQSEAWFAFWIDSESGDILKLAMIANNHYMVWVYSDMNDDFVIQPPEGASPIATPIA